MRGCEEGAPAPGASRKAKLGSDMTPVYRLVGEGPNAEGAERESAAFGIVVTFNDPTREMEKEAASAGFGETGGRKIPQAANLHCGASH